MIVENGGLFHRPLYDSQIGNELCLAKRLMLISKSRVFIFN